MTSVCDIARRSAPYFGTEKLIKNCVFTTTVFTDALGLHFNCGDPSGNDPNKFCENDFGSDYRAENATADELARLSKPSGCVFSYKFNCWKNTAQGNQAACCAGGLSGKENCKPVWKKGGYFCNKFYGSNFKPKAPGKLQADLEFVSDPRPLLYITSMRIIGPLIVALVYSVIAVFLRI